MNLCEIKICPSETMLGPFDMDFDPALVTLGVRKRHFEPGGLPSYMPSCETTSSPLTLDEETEQAYADGLKAIP
jgi:hypothetical protein